MLDTVSFISRLKTIFTHNELSSAAFADLIAVQRSSISHILNGRNKPSLEFIMKVNDAFPEVDLQWLLYGKGNYPKTKTSDSQKSTKGSNDKIDQTIGKKLEHIIMFYSDGTFKTYTEL
ncbi:helix-turn-helix transcriptional regulator [uncultured Maribacter sp.]|uniref:helix-turn-helix domain-containing protein n=1 Tax=uncultured Maribacter sp. TaxID=431308 RepID=UPI002602F968|nr:helix-turn-helix transcriptional regulator [uncultured Maribacter sp.]